MKSKKIYGAWGAGVIAFALATIWAANNHQLEKDGQIECAQKAYKTSVFLKEITSDIENGQIEAAFSKLVPVLSPDCPVTNTTEAKSDLLGPLLDNFLTKAPTQYGWQLASVAKPLAPEFREILAKNLKPLPLGPAQKINFIAGYPDSETYKTIGAEILQALEKKETSPDQVQISVFPGRDGLRFFTWAENVNAAGESDIIEFSSGTYVNGKIVTLGEEPPFGSPDLIYTVEGDDSKIYGMVQINWTVAPEEIDQDTQCSARYTFFSIDPFGLSRRFIYFDNYKCVDFGPKSSMASDSISKRLSEKISDKVIAALSQTPDVVGAIDFSRRDAGDRALIDSMLKSNGGVLPLLDSILKANSMGGDSFDQTSTESSDPPQGACGIKDTLSWAFHEHINSLAPIWPQLENISSFCSNWQSAKETVEKLQDEQKSISDQLGDPIRMTFILTREAGPNDNINFGPWNHIYLALRQGANYEPIIIRSQKDLTSGGPMQSGVFFESNDTYKIYQNGFWRNLKTYDIPEEADNLASIDGNLNEATKNLNKYKKGLLQEINMLKASVYSYGQVN